MDNLSHDLFLLMLHLCQIKNEATLISVFIDALNSFSIGITFRHSTENLTETQFVIPLCTTRYCFGTICLEGEVTRLSPDRAMIVKNAIRMLAMILENHQQARLLQDEKLCLEEAVRERTAALEDYQRKLRSLATQLVLVEEKERRRVAANLHDSACQHLAMLKMKLKGLESRLIDTSDSSLDEACDDIESIMQDLRAMTFDLSPPTLYLCGLEAAVEKLLDQELQEKQGIDVEFEALEGYLPLTEEVRIMLYQCVRELVVNIVKHSRASLVKISIKPKNSNIQVMVQDNGIGFDVQQVEQSFSKSGGFGLLNIAERLRSMGGSFDVQAQPGQGARFTLIAPLESLESRIVNSTTK